MQNALDLFTFGMGYPHCRRPVSRKLIGLSVPLAQYMRRAVKERKFFQIRVGQVERAFMLGSVIHLREADMVRRSMACPNGCRRCSQRLLTTRHAVSAQILQQWLRAGFILYLSHAQGSQTDMSTLRALKSARGLGDFKNQGLRSPKVRGKTCS
ncbi:hypothetical protein [Stenotrophomonas sp. B1-1]|uniref:hypothetical protein n=1 Tax=Stenotrophomonas sp. B1-1 TaxID=2710648 RepID=UPI0019681C7D|nr:hypothetical protein [Stenotrophomonas sp. B1-1]